jgi:hypothetical protein
MVTKPCLVAEKAHSSSFSFSLSSLCSRKFSKRLVLFASLFVVVVVVVVAALRFQDDVTGLRLAQDIDIQRWPPNQAHKAGQQVTIEARCHHTLWATE